MSELQPNESEKTKNESDVDALSQSQHRQQIQTNKPAHSFDAHLVTSINRDTTLAAPQIDNIIEEEEEEIDETATNVKVVDFQIPHHNEPTKVEKLEESKETAPQLTSTSVAAASSSKPHESTIKFILEPVVLPETTSPAAGSSELTNVNVVNNESSEPPPVIVSSPETGEIRVEEGQATRQMDEFFRQTIAAIKEELTKKLETQNEKNDEELDGYETDTDFDDDSLMGVGSGTDFDRTFDPDMDEDHDPEAHTSPSHRPHHHHHNYIHNLRNNRALLYNHIMTLLSMRRPTKRDRINGWLVIIGCFLNQFIIDGLCYNYAALFDLVQTSFELDSKLVASLPGTFLIGFFILITPLATFLTKQYGTRKIAIVGTFISTLSLLISSFLNNIVLFTIFYGLFTGVGIGLVYIPSLITTSRWFLKRRLFANSLNVLGACLGAAIYPLVTEILIKHYQSSLYDTLLILAAIQFNCLVGSMLLRSNDQLRGTKSTTDNKKRTNSNKTNNNNSSNNLTSPLIRNNKTNGPSGRINAKRGNRGGVGKRGVYKRGKDVETESTVSTSTASQSYTLKQHWRRFVQTRQTSANAKKNLFHLIAEEKKKTRTLSKQSLEDGFYITTSNNLLAPNDASNVVVTRSENAAALHALNAGHHHAASRSSRFFSRIANSIRSLAHPNHPAATHASNNSPANTTPHSKNHLAIHEISETATANSPITSKNSASALLVPSPLAR
jgi:hypothetical protein